MLTPEELTQARLLSSPEIPDDDVSAWGQARQLVRKMLAHIDFITLHHTECEHELHITQEESRKAIRNSTDAHVECDQMRAKLHAALAAKEKAEAMVLEAESNAVEMDEERMLACEHRSVFQSKCAELQAENAALKDASVSTGKELNKLQAIVDRLQGDDRMKRFDLDLPSQFVPHTPEENAAMEAALSAAASSKNKESK